MMHAGALRLTPYHPDQLPPYHQNEGDAPISFDIVFEFERDALLRIHASYIVS